MDTYYFYNVKKKKTCNFPSEGPPLWHSGRAAKGSLNKMKIYVHVFMMKIITVLSKGWLWNTARLSSVFPVDLKGETLQEQKGASFPEPRGLSLGATVGPLPTRAGSLQDFRNQAS